MIRHEFGEGKYTVIFPEKPSEGTDFECLRHGETWRSLTGDGMVLAMLQDYDTLKNELEQVYDRLGLKEENRCPDSVTGKMILDKHALRLARQRAENLELDLKAANEHWQETDARCGELQDFLKECDDYLDTTKGFNIRHGSILHQKMKELLKAEPSYCTCTTWGALTPFNEQYTYCPHCGRKINPAQKL